MISCSKEHPSKAAMEGSLGPLSLMENASEPDMTMSYCLISSKLLMLKEEFFFCLIKQHHDY